MPVYEYTHVGQPATACKDPFEVTQSIKADALILCPSCGVEIKRLISRTSFTWKNGAAPTPKTYS